MTTALFRLITASAMCVSGCSDTASTSGGQSDGAVLRVLREQARLANVRNDSLAAAPQPTNAATVLARFGTDLAALDLSGCPQDFQGAFREYVQSCGLVQAAVKQLPADISSQSFLDVLSGIEVGDADASDLKNAITEAQARWLAVKQIGLMHAPMAFMLDYPAETGVPTLGYWNAVQRVLGTLNIQRGTHVDFTAVPNETATKAAIHALTGLNKDGVDFELLAWSARVIALLQAEVSQSRPSAAPAASGVSVATKSAQEQLALRLQLREVGNRLRASLSDKYQRPFPEPIL
jgi:hypothetical protein